MREAKGTGMTDDQVIKFVNGCAFSFSVEYDTYTLANAT